MNLQIEYVPIDTIKPYAGNAKLHPQEQIDQIKTSIDLVGFNDPIAIWKNGEIIEGHGRLLAAQQLGMKEVPIIRLDDLTDEQRRAYTLIHNKLTMNTDFDLEVMNIELAEIQEIDMECFGFDVEPIDLDLNEKNVVEDDYNAEPPAEPKSKIGDIYQLGRHRLMCGDSTDIQNLKQLTGGSLLICFSPIHHIMFLTKERQKTNSKLKTTAWKILLFVNFCAIRSLLQMK